jgi:hypothetical protein
MKPVLDGSRAVEIDRTPMKRLHEWAEMVSRFEAEHRYDAPLYLTPSDMRFALHMLREVDHPGEPEMTALDALRGLQELQVKRMEEERRCVDYHQMHGIELDRCPGVRCGRPASYDSLFCRRHSPLARGEWWLMSVIFRELAPIIRLHKHIVERTPHHLWKRRRRGTRLRAHGD